MKIKHFAFIGAIAATMISPSVFAQYARTAWTEKGQERARIVEKGSTRYFQLGDQEYVCNADNRISDASAEQILKTVRKIYSATDVKKDTKKEHDAIIDSLWTTFHQVCTPGELYDQILFICLKHKLNILFELVTTKNQYTNRGKAGDSETRIIIPGISHITVFYDYNIIRRYRDGSVGVVKIDDGIDHFGIYFGYVRVEEAGIHEYTYQDSLAQLRRSRWTGSQLGSFEDAGRNRISNAFSSRLQAIKKSPGDRFLNPFTSILKHYEDNCDTDSFIFDSEWDQVLLTSARLILAFRKDHLSGKRKSDYDKDAMDLFATKMMNSCLEFCKTEKTKKELLGLANKNKLKVTVPKPKDEGKTPLF